MKTLKVLILLIPFNCYLISCSDSTLGIDSSHVSLGATVEVKGGNKVTFNNPMNNQDIEVKVLSISDYRCPSDVVCVWEGNAKVGFQIGTNKNIIYLCVFENEIGCQQNIVVYYEDMHFSLKLLDVLPYPTATNTEVEKVAKFQLSVHDVNTGG